MLLHAASCNTGDLIEKPGELATFQIESNFLFCIQHHLATPAETANKICGGNSSAEMNRILIAAAAKQLVSCSLKQEIHIHISDEESSTSF